MNGKEGYVVSCNEEGDEWYIIRRIKEGGSLRRVVLPERYRYESDATEAMICMIEAER